MTNNDLTLIIRGTEFVFDSVDRLVHFAQGYNAGQFHTSMAQYAAKQEEAQPQYAYEDHAKGLDTDEDVHAMLEKAVYGDEEVKA